MARYEALIPDEFPERDRINEFKCYCPNALPSGRVYLKYQACVYCGKLIPNKLRLMSNDEIARILFE